MKRIISLLICFILSLSFFSCNNNIQINEESTKEVSSVFVPTENTSESVNSQDIISITEHIIETQDTKSELTITTVAQHEHSFNNWVISIEPSCSNEGLLIRVCSTCGFEEKSSIDKKTHTPVIDSAISPTCETSGKTEGSHCSVCGIILVEQQTITETGHIFGNWSVTKEASEFASGEKTRICEVCGKKEFVEIPKINHSHSFSDTWSFNETTHWNECACGQKNNHSEHSWGNWISINEPSCSTEGLKKHSCSICGYEESVAIKKLEHTPVIDIAVEPTCTEPGKTQGSHCSVCGAIISEQKVIPVLLKYRLKSDKTYQIEGFSANEVEQLILPSSFQGKEVSSIANSAFSNARIKSLTIPSSITIIGEKAFFNCSSLESIIIPQSIESIGNNAFYGCNKIIENINSNIVNNTEWSDNRKIYVLNNSIQIASTATLTINQGVRLIGNQCDIINYGTLNLIGTKNDNVCLFDVNLVSKNASGPNTFNLSYITMHGGVLFPATGVESSSVINIDSCRFIDGKDYTYSYIWYPQTCSIKNCYFEEWPVLTIGTSGPVSICNNTFYKCGKYISYGEPYLSVINCWASYGGPITVTNNNFIQPYKYALSLQYNSSDINAQSNWFGTVDSSEIERLIWDGNDDFGIPQTINYSNYLTSEIFFD